MNKIKRYRLSQAMYDIIQKANGGLFLLYTRHNPGDVLNLLLDGNDSRMIEFYVTGKQYDVFHLAFKGFTKC